MKIAVCDDEIQFIEKIAILIKKQFQGDIERLDTFTGSKELLAADTDYDLIFLDIDMPELDGISTAKYYEKNSAVIFVTNQEALVFEAYNSTDSFGFVRKSKLREDFESVFERFQKMAKTDYLSLKTNDKTLKIKISEIDYIEKIVNSVIYHTSKGNYTERNTLSKLEKTLGEYGFIRTHIGYLVNADHIENISSKDITLSNSEKIPVSRNNLKAVKTEFLKRSVQHSE